MLVQNADDPSALWNQAESAFGASVTTQLQLVGQLAYLTANNAPRSVMSTSAQCNGLPGAGCRLTRSAGAGALSDKRDQRT